MNTTGQPQLNRSATRPIAVIGAGYVGLTIAACLAKLGHTVICGDIVPEKIKLLKAGQIPILEDGMAELVAEGLASGRLQFVLGSAAAARRCGIVFMCLPTPQGADGAADLSFLHAAAGDIAPVLPAGAIVVNKSTVPVGTAAGLTRIIGRDDVVVASNPEFLREGTAVYDFFHPDRIVIGAPTPEAAAAVAAVYDGVEAPRLIVETPTAELIKYASNAFLATKITFANSIAALCEELGADAGEVLRGMGYDQRIGPKFLRPGPGWGGSCFPKDVSALAQTARSVGYNFELLKSVISANRNHIKRTVSQVTHLLGGDTSGKTVAVWGLAFKAGTDDLRDSPALAIINELRATGASIQAYDPGVKQPVAGITKTASALDACKNADALLVLTEWPEFGQISLCEVSSRLREKRVLDTRGALNPRELENLGFEYQVIGRRTRARARQLT